MMISPNLLIAQAAQQISLTVKKDESKKPKSGKKAIKFQNSLFLEIINIASKSDEHNLF